jgi:hypothetical protein
MNKEYKSQQEIDAEITDILNKNKIEDLKTFLEKRNCLNNTNQILNYMFHVVQSAGVLTTTIAAGYNMKSLVWVGVGMNILASLINIFEKTNDSISRRLFKNIQSIKNGTYIDEGMMVDVDSKPGDNKPYSEKYENSGTSGKIVEKPISEYDRKTIVNTNSQDAILNKTSNVNNDNANSDKTESDYV